MALRPIKPGKGLRGRRQGGLALPDKQAVWSEPQPKGPKPPKKATIGPAGGKFKMRKVW